MCHSVCPRKAELACFHLFYFPTQEGSIAASFISCRPHCCTSRLNTQCTFFKWIISWKLHRGGPRLCIHHMTFILMLVLKTVPFDEHSYILYLLHCFRFYTNHPVSRRWGTLVICSDCVGWLSKNLNSFKWHFQSQYPEVHRVPGHRQFDTKEEKPAGEGGFLFAWNKSVRE